MTPVPLDDRLSVAAQLGVADLARVAALGFRQVIGNRPDGEVIDQPDAASLAAEARRLGLAFVHLPVVASAIDDADVAAFAAALAGSAGPTLAFCRTGTRSATLWALAEAGRRPAEALLGAAARAGYDLAALRPRLDAAAARFAAARDA